MNNTNTVKHKEVCENQIPDKSGILEGKYKYCDDQSRKP